MTPNFLSQTLMLRYAFPLICIMKLVARPSTGRAFWLQRSFDWTFFLLSIRLAALVPKEARVFFLSLSTLFSGCSLLLRYATPSKDPLASSFRSPIEILERARLHLS